MLKNICKAQREESMKMIGSADPVSAALRHSLPKHVTGSSLATFFFTSQCFIIKNFKHTATSKEFSEHSYTHPSSNSSIFLYLLPLTAVYPLMIIFRLLIYIGKYSSKHVLSEHTVLSPDIRAFATAHF